MKIKVYKKPEEEQATDKAIMVDDEDLLGTYTWDEAKKQIALLNSFNYKGYDDWRLPTKEELDQMYKIKEEIGGFSSSIYWSSTENNSSYAWYQNFSNGYQSSNYKGNFDRVRCVRYINIY